MANITSLNTAYSLSIPGLFPAVLLQGFSADDIFTTDTIERIETMIGVDGILSAGLVAVKISQKISLQGDSPSMAVFETWRAAEQAILSLYPANATVSFPSLGRKYTCKNGYLTNYAILSDARRVLQPRSFTITWESVTAAPN